MSSHIGTGSVAANPNWPAVCAQWIELTGAVRTPERVFEYVKVQLSGRGIHDGYDAHHTSQAVTTSLFFPRGQVYNDSDGNPHIARYLTLFHNLAEVNQHSAAEIRAKLLGLSMGRAALRRYNVDAPFKRTPTLNEQALRANKSPQYYAEHRYEKSNVPLAIISISRVIRHRLAAPGSTVAFLYVPVDVPALDGLTWFQENLRQSNQRA